MSKTAISGICAPDAHSSGVLIDRRVIGIIGSRRRNASADYKLLLSELRKLGVGPGDSFVSGGCPKGGDRFAEVIAKKYGIPISIHYPDWDKHGRSAGLLRNSDIALDADILIAVVAADRQGGTEDTIRKYQNLGKGQLILVPQVGEFQFCGCHQESHIEICVDCGSNPEVVDDDMKPTRQHGKPLCPYCAALRIKCPICKRSYTPELPPRDGRLIQEQFPDAAPWEREQLLTGICSQECWDGIMIPEPDDLDSGGEA